MEILINANTLGLEISEIEGDAILFYKFGEPPQLKELYGQVQGMFCAFHKNLIAYEERRYCQCKACMSAVGLTLKVITHYGEFTEYNVKNFIKLIGRDLIVAHQLLKNDIEQHEYWLITKNLLQDRQPEGFAEWMKWHSSTKQTEGGKIIFQYTQLSELKKDLLPEPSPHADLSEKVKMISVKKTYETDIITLFHATGDFNYRVHWLEGLKTVDEVDHFLPRVGMKCKYVKNSGEKLIIRASSYMYSENRIEFSETPEDEMTSICYTLEKIDESSTKLILKYYIRESFVRQIVFNLMQRKKLETTLLKSLENLVGLVKEIRI